MAGIQFGDHSPGWHRAYHIVQLAMAAICVAVLILTLVLWDIKYIPVVFLAAGVSNAMEAADRWRKKRSGKREIGKTVVFLLLALLCFALAAAGIFLLWR